MYQDHRPVMAVKTNILFKDFKFLGFCEKDKHDFLDVIQKNKIYGDGHEMDTDKSFKQIVSYVLLRNVKTNKIYAYQRSTNPENYGYKEMFGMYSWGIGSHILEQFHEKSETFTDTIRSCLLDEIDLNILDIKHIGYTNLEHGISAFHFGLLYQVDTDSDHIIHKVKQNEHGDFMDIMDILELSETHQAEDWSQAAVEYLLTIAI
jgi:predicted NUDIX family phosphoesterase